jgi:hypothetical protein
MEALTSARPDDALRQRIEAMRWADPFGTHELPAAALGRRRCHTKLRTSSTRKIQ